MARYKVTSRTINLRGGSYTVVIPFDFVSDLGLKESDQIVFVLDKKKKFMIVGKANRFSFSSKELENDQFELGVFKTELTGEDIADIKNKNKR